MSVAVCAYPVVAGWPQSVVAALVTVQFLWLARQYMRSGSTVREFVLNSWNIVEMMALMLSLAIVLIDVFARWSGQEVRAEVLVCVCSWGSLCEVCVTLVVGCAGVAVWQLLDALQHTDVFLDMWSRVLLFRKETDLVSFTIILATVRAIKVPALCMSTGELRRAERSVLWLMWRKVQFY